MKRREICFRKLVLCVKKVPFWFWVQTDLLKVNKPFVFSLNFLFYYYRFIAMFLDQRFQTFFEKIFFVVFHFVILKNLEVPSWGTLEVHGLGTPILDEIIPKFVVQKIIWSYRKFRFIRLITLITLKQCDYGKMLLAQIFENFSFKKSIYFNKEPHHWLFFWNHIWKTLI